MFKCKDLYISLALPEQNPGGVDPFGRDQKNSTPNCSVILQTGHLKEYLVRALAIVVELEKELEEHPQTVAEVEVLEVKLKEALGELQARKAELESRAA